MIDYGRLRGKIAEKYPSMRAFSEDIGMSPQQVSKLVSGYKKTKDGKYIKDDNGNDVTFHTDIQLSTMQKIVSVLGLTNEEIRSIFFA